MRRTRTLVATAVAVAALAAPAAARTPAVGFSLPHPTGRSEVGTVALWWVDPHRLDPLAPRRELRQLMVQLWYPAAGPGRREATYLPRDAARVLDHGLLHLVAFALARVPTRAQVEAPVAPGRHPVVLFSPGFEVPRELYTSLVEDLASRGYVVVALDHTHETPAVEFPHGRVELGRMPPTLDSVNRALGVRVKDVEFVLDRLPTLERTGRFAGRLDLTRIGMFGHSLGGATAAAAMAIDPRIKAGVDLDGSFFGVAADHGVRAPFLLLASDRDLRDDPSYGIYLLGLDGSRLALKVAATQHFAFSDVAAFADGLHDLNPEFLTIAAVGSIRPLRALAIERAYVAAFFDAHLRGRREPLLAGSSRRYPEVTFVRIAPGP